MTENLEICSDFNVMLAASAAPKAGIVPLWIKKAYEDNLAPRRFIFVYFLLFNHWYHLNAAGR